MIPSSSPSPVHSVGEGVFSFADPILWRRLLETGSAEEFSASWLSLQVRLLSGVHSGMVVLASTESGPFTPTAVWPENLPDPSSLAKVTERALNERKGIVIRDESPEFGKVSGGMLLIAFPIRVGGRPFGAVTFRIRPKEKDDLQSTMRIVQWGCAWLESWVLRKEAEREDLSHEGTMTALDMAAAALEEERFRAAATTVATLLATRFGCDRVSIGFTTGRHIRVQALSHAAQFKRKMNLIRSIGAAMDESVDQQQAIVFPDLVHGNIVRRAHEELAALQGDGAVCTIPFLGRDRQGYGAITCERTAEKPFTELEVKFLEGVGALLAPILEEKRRNDRLILIKISESVKNLLTRLVGPRNVALKIATASGLILLLLLGFVDGTYRVSAKTVIEGAVQRAITAPFDGFIADSMVRPGDRVAAGQVLCSLDERDLRLQYLRWLSQRDQYQRQFREAMATSNRASMRILGEQINQAEAQMALLQDHLDRSKLTSPFDGIIISGDLSQSMGAPVQKGQVLFEVAPLGDYRVKLQVDEHDINNVAVGQRGTLVLNSLPEISFPLSVRKMTPVSTTEEGVNFFVVEASLDYESDRLRPGMEGVGKVVVGKRRLIWVLTHDIVDWFRLWVWSWWP